MNIKSASFLSGMFLAGMMAISSLATASETLTGAAPNFTLKGSDGKNHKLSEYRGQVVMLNFWASWCGPCRQEMPLLDDIYKKYQKLGFVILGVNVEEDSSKAKSMLKTVGVSFPVLFDTSNKVSKQYNVVAMPSSVMIDRNGNMRYLHKGYKPGYERDYLNQVRELARE